MSTISASTTTTTAYKVTADTTGALVLQTGSTPTTAVTIDTSQNVGIGTSSPTQKLQVAGKIAVSGTNPSIQQIVQNSYLDLCGGTTVGTDPSIQIAGSTTTSDANKIFYNSNTHVFRSSSGGTTYSTIDSSGNLLVGTTSVAGTNGITLYPAYNGAGSYGAILWNKSITSGVACEFRHNGTSVGAISANTTTTTYATSSDYRLKENIAPMTGALATVAQLKPCTYTWKADGSTGQGFIAHELQEVVPDCVTGAKDAVDEDGNPVYQGIDVSFLVATLTAAIQELTARIEALENK